MSGLELVDLFLGPGHRVLLCSAALPAPTSAGATGRAVAEETGVQSSAESSLDKHGPYFPTCERQRSYHLAVSDSKGKGSGYRPTTRGATLRLVRAAGHLDEIGRVIEDYRANHPNPMRVFVPTEQVSTGRYRPMFDWAETGEPPRLQLAILVGEFSYNLRAALDYLVHQLAALDGAAPRFRNFPIEVDPKNWQKRRTTWLRRDQG